jgi:translocating chain-associated membrane protein 1
MPLRGKKSTKNPPIMSHEFVIQNHADIVACVAMVFVVGLMFQVSSPLASVFIALQHNVSVPVETMPGVTQDMTFYTAGLKDIPATFFYLLIAVVIHAIIQEYLLDKVNKKLHLSKIKHAKFDESGQLLSFYLVSIVWGVDIMMRENLYNISNLWDGYPHQAMSFMFKFFFLVQISYWLHIFPELYFQKVKKDEMAAKIQYACLYLAFIVSAYFLCFTRVTVILLVLHYTAEAVYHASRILAYADKTSVSKNLFKLGDLLFVLARLGSVIVSVLTFWYGLALAPAETQVVDLATGNFNTGLFRFNALVAVCLLQAWLMWNFIMFQVKRMREAKLTSGSGGSGAAGKKGKTQQERAKARKERKEGDARSEDDELPEVDQDTNLRKRVK